MFIPLFIIGTFIYIGKLFVKMFYLCGCCKPGVSAAERANRRAAQERLEELNNQKTEDNEAGSQA